MQNIDPKDTSSKMGTHTVNHVCFNCALLITDPDISICPNCGSKSVDELRIIRNHWDNASQTITIMPKNNA